MSSDAGFIPKFKMVRRGFDPVQVNAYLSALAGERGPLDAYVARAGERFQAPATFAVVRRGYDPAEVNRYIRELLGKS